MTVSSAANAVLAKARAMYGKRLTAQNYTDLLACRSVNEAAAYLKAHTAYADAFEGVTMGSLRRWQIEILLREHLSNNFASLCRYEKSIGDGFYKYFVTLSDVDMLLHSVRYLNSRHPEKNLAKVPDFFVRHSELNAAALWKENRKRCNEIYTKLVDLNTVFEMRRYAACHNKYFFYVGWVLAHDSKAFEKKAEAIENVEVEENDPDKSSGKTPPVKLRNPAIFKPYEYFVDMYGLPSYSDIDVTGFVAITYTLLFGIMFGDLGQGLVLFLLGILGWKIKKMPLARILIPCGLSSAVFGFVFGSVFGYEDMLDPVYHALGMASKPLSVMDSINTVLIVAIGIGVVLVVTAMLLNVISCLKHKKIGEAIFSNNGLVGILFYLAGVAFCVAFMNGPQVLPNSVLFSVMGVCAVLLYIKEIPIGIIDKHPDWKPDSIVDFLLQNLFELIEYVLSYFSNTVSFLRVGAFVIVHASMMMVVFTLGGDGSNIPVIIIGNIIVIALEGLLSGIQGLRLEFYEMFSRFYEGGGRAFTPAKLEQAQTNLKTKIAGKKAKKALANKD